MDGDQPTTDLATALAELGFSQYEARCYVGLMTREPQTGYGVSKSTGVPQPKVYETLRKLVGRGVVHEIAGDPTRFSAVPPSAVLAGLEDSFDRRLESARQSVRALSSTEIPPHLEYVERFEQYTEIMAAAAAAVDGAQRRVYLSASSAELSELLDPVRRACERGVDVVVLAFGRKRFAIEGARVFHHASTDGAIFRHHQARHVALVVDSRLTVNAVAADGRTWQAVRTASEPIIAAVKGFIRHDIDLQQVFAAFRPQLLEAYGPGLQALESYRQDPVATAGAAGGTTPATTAETAAEAPAPARRGKRRTG